MKRIVSCLLTVVLLFCLLSVQVAAAEPAVRAELVLADSGEKSGEQAIYTLQFRLYGEELGNVAMAYVAIDNTVFTPMQEQPSFRTQDLWMNGATAMATQGNITYLRLEVDRGDTPPLPYSAYTEASYTNAPAIATVKLLLAPGETPTADAVRFINVTEAASFNAPSAVFACSAADFYLYNAVDGAAGKTMDAAVTLQAAAGVTVSGKVTSYNPGNETLIQLKQGYTVKYITTIASEAGNGQKSQTFAIQGVAAGTYDLVVTKAGHLTFTVTGIPVASTALDLTQSANSNYNEIVMLAGDVNGDSSITENDVSVIRYATNINKSTANAADKTADVNGDGSVTENDVSIVRYPIHINKGLLQCTFVYTN